MHIFVSGIGGVGMSPLALIATQAGHTVSGSDKQSSQYIDYLHQKGISHIHIGQSADKLAALHAERPIDWLVYSSAVEKENPDHPELAFAREHGIKLSKRDELLNHIIEEKRLKLIAIAGTHGKTTTTAMVTWLFKELGVPVSYSVGAKVSFGDMGQFDPESEYFVYEADEFDRNFLAFSPYLSIVSGVSYDHHEIYPTRDDYKQAFRQFISQSQWTILWDREADYLDLESQPNIFAPPLTDPRINELELAGRYNRENASLALQAVAEVLQEPYEKLADILNRFPGLHRRMEQITPNLYSDEAHTPDKIRGAMSVATELARDKNQGVVVVYEPLTNRRQHYMLDDYKDCFNGAKKVYWLPSYLAREDPGLRIIEPQELIERLTDPSIAEAARRDDTLKQAIQQHLDHGDMVVGMAGGGGNSLDEWLRDNFAHSA